MLQGRHSATGDLLPGGRSPDQPQRLALDRCSDRALLGRSNKVGSMQTLSPHIPWLVLQCMRVEEVQALVRSAVWRRDDAADTCQQPSDGPTHSMFFVCSTWVTINSDTRKLAKIPEDVKQRFRRLAPNPPRHVLPDKETRKKLPDFVWPPQVSGVLYRSMHKLVENIGCSTCGCSNLGNTYLAVDSLQHCHVGDTFTLCVCCCVQ